MKKKILLAFDDPGGGLAVSSLIESINKEIISDQIIYTGKLSRRFINEDLSVNAEVREISSFIDREDADKIIETDKPDIIITGTGGGNAEQELRNSAFRKNIKSVVILDYWKDYSRRWKYADHTFEEMKDIIFVMDEQTREEMILENFKKENILITGHPYLDKIFNNYPESSAAKIPDTGIRKILFLSQPLDIIGVKEYDTHPLELFLRAMTQISFSEKEKLSVKIKLHPSEQRSEEITSITRKFNMENPAAEIVSDENSLNELIKESDLVAGYNTIALFEARASGKRVISLKVAEIKNSLKQAMINAGIEITGADLESIIDCINTNKPETADIKKFSGGIENCIKELKKELSIN